MMAYNPYSSVSRDPRERAKSLLLHYFDPETITRSITSDNVMEIGQIVDEIVCAARDGLESQILELRRQLHDVAAQLNEMVAAEQRRTQR